MRVFDGGLMEGFFDGGFWLAGCGLFVRLLQERRCCCGWVMLEIKGNMRQCKSALRTLYIGFRKTKLKKS
jgi:hypothetical protein